MRPVLGPDHPFHSGSVPEDVGEHALLEPGSALPPFTVRAVDAYGITCVPSASLQWRVELQSDAVTPCPGVATPDASGAATLQNVHVAHGVKKAADWSVPAELRVVPVAAAEGLAGAAAEAAAAVEGLGDLKLLLAPSRAPAAMTVIREEDELPFKMVEGAEGESRRAYQARASLVWTACRPTAPWAVSAAIVRSWIAITCMRVSSHVHAPRVVCCCQQTYGGAQFLEQYGIAGSQHRESFLFPYVLLDTAWHVLARMDGYAFMWSDRDRMDEVLACH